MCFDKDWTKKEIRGLIAANRCNHSHKNLRAISLIAEDWESETRDWSELQFVVPTDWLKAFIKKWNMSLKKFFEEYTSSESEEVFETAIAEKQIVMVSFD